MGLEGKSINKVKFQPVPANTKRERSSNLADSGKKVPPGVAVPFSTFYRDSRLAQRRRSTFLPVSKTFLMKRFPRITEHVIWGVMG
jgi:hypothetical protein